MNKRKNKQLHHENKITIMCGDYKMRQSFCVRTGSLIYSRAVVLCMPACTRETFSVTNLHHILSIMSERRKKRARWQEEEEEREEEEEKQHTSSSSQQRSFQVNEDSSKGKIQKVKVKEEFPPAIVSIVNSESFGTYLLNNISTIENDLAALVRSHKFISSYFQSLARNDPHTSSAKNAIGSAPQLAVFMKCADEIAGSVKKNISKGMKFALSSFNMISLNPDKV
jgi:hypothetical protein